MKMGHRDWCDVICQDEAGQDEAGQDEAGRDEAGRDEAGRDDLFLTYSWPPRSANETKQTFNLRE